MKLSYTITCVISLTLLLLVHNILFVPTSCYRRTIETREQHLTTTESSFTYDSTTRRTATKNDEGRGLAITIGFNYRKDPQRKDYVLATFDYIKSWYQSLHSHPSMQGMVIGNMYDENFRDNYTDSQVSFYHIDPTTHPSFIDIPRGLDRSINDQRFLAIEWVLNETLFGVNHKNINYVLLSDSHDVEFLRNPFDYMQKIDDIMPEHQLFVGQEPAPNMRWMNKIWKQCFNGPRPYGSNFNAGVIGGHLTVVRKLLRHMNEIFLDTSMLEKIDIGANCNMVVLEKVLMTKFQGNVVGGYPFHTKYKNFETNLTSLAFIRHK